MDAPRAARIIFGASYLNYLEGAQMAAKKKARHDGKQAPPLAVVRAKNVQIARDASADEKTKITGA